MGSLQRAISSQSPTRVDLAGGTLDCWPLYLFVGDCVTVNLAIDVYTGCELRVLPETKEIEVEISDLEFQKTYQDIDSFLASREPEIKLLQAVIEYFHPAQGFQLKTYSKSPVGGGLGGSSSLCISLIKAFSSTFNSRLKDQQLNDKQLSDKALPLYETVTLASNLEAKVIHAPTGTQDYFPAIEPGLHVIHYGAVGVRLETLSVSMAPLFDNLLLVYTGRAHHSGINNWQVIKSIIEGHAKPLAALKEIAQVSAAMADACRAQKWNLLPELFAAEFRARIQLSDTFTSPEIEQVKKLVVEHGAQAVKICGAGGGGCVLVWAEPQHHERIFQACQRNGFQPIRIRPVSIPRPTG